MIEEIGMSFKMALQGKFLCGAVPAAGPVTSAFTLKSRPVPGIEPAKKMGAACHKCANRKGWKVNIAALDDGGKNSASGIPV
jgi:hypothetical protein